MLLIPAFEIGVWNAWWFMIVFLLQWLAVVIVGARLTQRTGSPPGTEQNQTARRIGTVAMTTWVVATLYSIFVPFQVGTPWLWTGLVLFLAGLSVLVLATLSIAGTPADKPFTSGVYRFSRHPGYLSMILIYLGVSITTTSWLFFLITIATFILQRGIAIFEEDYCLKRYGDTYREYMNRTPRWIGIPKTG